MAICHSCIMLTDLIASIIKELQKINEIALIVRCSHYLVRQLHKCTGGRN